VPIVYAWFSTVDKYSHARQFHQIRVNAQPVLRSRGYNVSVLHSHRHCSVRCFLFTVQFVFFSLPYNEF